MTERSPSLGRRLGWVSIYTFVVAGSAVAAAELVGMPRGDVFPVPRSLEYRAIWAVGYGVMRAPIAAAELLLLVYLYRSATDSWRLWGLGIVVPVGLELVWQAFFGGLWLREGVAWLWLWRQPPEYLAPLDLVWRVAFSELVPPCVAGACATGLARYQAASRSTR